MALTEEQKKKNNEYKKKFMAGKKNIGITVPEDTYERFAEKLKQDKLTKQDVIETAIHQYINGELRINKIK